MPYTKNFKNRLTIGVLDSGLGGLTVLRSLLKRARLLDLKLTPHFIYLADTQRFPYGQRDPAQIHEFACQMIDWLAAKGCDVVVIACHTISTTGAFDQPPVPIYDMREIGSRLTILEAKKIVVLSTPTTASTSAISKSIAANHPAISVLEIGCPELASIIEHGAAGNDQGTIISDQLHKILNGYAQKIMDARADTVVLGCTHYPLIAGLLGQLLSGRINIIDPAIQFADYFFEQLGFKLNQNTHTNSGEDSRASKAEMEIAFHVSGNLAEFKLKLNNCTPDLRGTVSSVTIDELESSSSSDPRHRI